MPVFDQGYRPYEGPRIARAVRFWPITRTCFRNTVRWPFFVILFVGMFPLMYRFFEAYATGAGAALFPMFRTKWGFGDGLFFELISSEIFIAMLLLTVTGSGQIANDLRTGALQLYFARPITQADYVLGKLGAVVLSGLLVTLVPGVLLLFACMAFAPDFSFLAGNPWLPLKILGFSLLVSVVLGSLILAISSLGKQGRMVGITFAGGYFLTMVMSKALPRIFEDSRFEIVHIGRCLDAAGRTLFNDGTVTNAPADLALGILASLTILSIVILARRVDAVEVVR